ncbi:MAG: helix-turn-helix domain-containing protein, partial [Clostridia bacterium]
SFYANLVKRCALYYATVILESSGRTDMAWEVGELFHYVGNPMTRTLMSTAASSKFYWEPLTESTLADANAYIEHRRQTARSISLYGLDPETGKERLYSSSRESWLYMLKDVEVESWLNLDSRSVKLMRSHTGEVLALALIVPIHSGTLPVLKQDPLCGPYLASLSPAELRQLDVPPDRPAGWFNRSLDVSDVTDPDLRADVMKMFYSYICMGGLFIASPPATEMNELAHLSVGFEVVEGVSHTFYDGRTPTPTYVLDTRKERLKSYLARLMHHLSIPFEIHGSRPTLVEASRASSQLVEPLTKREQEVADLVLAGFSNAEIGTRLFLSEVTVKKHLTSVFAKMGVKTRSQLVRMMLQGEGE